MDLDFEKYCKVDQSPRTVLPSCQHHAKHEKNSNKPKSSSRNNHLSLEKGFHEIKLRNFHRRSASCKTLDTRNTQLPVDREELKRGSVYQSSNERNSSKRYDSVRGRKKIEFTVSGDSPFSFSLLDSICGSDEEEQKSSEMDNRETSFSMTADNQALQKSLSAKLALPHSPTHSDSDGPRKKTLRKSLLHDFSCAQYAKKDRDEIVSPSSPAHLHGDLKLENKHGVPYFELSMAHSDNVLVAKTWKEEDALNWVYTFHSTLGTKKSHKGSPIIAQMQVSCHLCSEPKEGKTLSNSIMTEFLLYDIMHARNSLADEESDEVAADLHPRNEAAAIAIQVPFDKRESLKHRSLNLSLEEQTNKGIADGASTRVNVVIPLGQHSLPRCGNRGPLPLLDRWRLGGGCDCGGWDMACPLLVFDNLSNQFKEGDCSLLHSNQPFSLYLKGAKEKRPALTMKFTRKGRYSVDFHAQLSALQAFSICVAILHASEASPMVDQEKHKQLLQCSSAKALVEDKVRILIEAITEEEKDKERKKVVKATQDHPPSFVLDPPFSPIARV